MCGIFGIRQGAEVADTVGETHKALKKLSYRGYDSWGIATEKDLYKKTGHVEEEKPEISGGKAVIGHTRWATHGEVTEENAHPHESCEERFSVAHNGVIENYEELKEKHEGHEYTSETDTEVIPHIIEHYVQRFDQEKNVADSLRYFDERAEGNYAILVLDKKKEELYALKQGSPLVFATQKGKTAPTKTMFASDIYAISEYTNEAYFMEDGDIIQTNGVNMVLQKNGEIQESIEMQEFEWTQEEKQLEEYDHWMRKEISEIPESIQDYLDSITGDQKEKLEQIVEKLENSEKVVFTASGSSYHASLLGTYYLQKAGVEAQALIASEFENYQQVDENTTVVAVSQSGETRDVLDAISVARENDADIVSLVNVPHSTIQRESDHSLEIRAGQEICVASTKTFINQLIALMSIAQRMGYETDLSGTPAKVKEFIEKHEDWIKKYSEHYMYQATEEDQDDMYIVGKGQTYPIAREIALKLKEIAYVHAEGMMAGELKHGTLALIEEGTPTIALDSEENSIQHTAEELDSRNAFLRILKDGELDLAPEIKYTLVGFLASYEIAKWKDLPIDKPRNLAKSVTVK